MGALESCEIRRISAGALVALAFAPDLYSEGLGATLRPKAGTAGAPPPPLSDRV